MKIGGYIPVKALPRANRPSIHPRLHSDNQPVTDCHQLPVALPVAIFISLEKKLTRAIFDFLHYIGRWW